MFIPLAVLGFALMTGCNNGTPPAAPAATQPALSTAHPRPPEVAPPPASRPTAEAVIHTQAPEPQPASVNIARTPITPTPAPAPTPVSDPRQELAYQSVQQAKAQSGDRPQVVILACLNYLSLHPTGAPAAEVQGIEDDALDTIWWANIDQLCRRRDQQQAAVADNKARITAQTKDDETPPALLEEKASLQKKLADTEEQLTALRYLAVQPPPLMHPAQMSRLRSARDPQVYAWWKKIEEQKIRESHGAQW